MKSYIAITALALLAGCSSNASKLGVPNQSGACDEVESFEITSERFDETAQQIAHASGCFIRTDLADTGSIKPNPVDGEMTRREAIATAIQGTGLTIVNHQPDEVTIK